MQPAHLLAEALECALDHQAGHVEVQRADPILLLVGRGGIHRLAMKEAALIGRSSRNQFAGAVNPEDTHYIASDAASRERT
jgi:hypothetical protein